MIKYGYITGDFDVDTQLDVVCDVVRYDSKGKGVNVRQIKTSRYVADKNVIIIGDNKDFHTWLNESKRPEKEME